MKYVCNAMPWEALGEWAWLEYDLLIFTWIYLNGKLGYLNIFFESQLPYRMKIDSQVFDIIYIYRLA